MRALPAPKRILRLTIKRQYFDDIRHGLKTTEYRSQSTYWLLRLVGRVYDEVHFYNGPCFSSKLPFMRVVCAGIVVPAHGTEVPEFGPGAHDVIHIKLGDVLEVRNVEEKQAG